MSHSTDDESKGDANQDWRMSSGVRQICRTSERGSVPEGAVWVQKNELLNVMYGIINNWKPKSEMWSLAYGSAMLAAMAGINGAIFTSHFRQRMVLRHRARLASYIPSVVIPGLTTNLGQQASLAERLFSTKPECVPCSQISAVSLQLTTGVAIPYIMSFFASAAVAKVTMVFPLPPVTDIMANYQTLRMLSQRLHWVAVVAVAGSVINTALVVRSQHKATARVHERMTQETFFIS